MANPTLAMLTLTLLGAAAPAPVSAPTLLVQDVTVHEKPAGGATWVTISWTVDTKTDPGNAAVALDAVCLIKGKEVRSAKAYALGKDKPKGQFPMKQGILSRGRPSWCDIQFAATTTDKPKEQKPLTHVCWTSGSAKPEPGACKR